MNKKIAEISIDLYQRGLLAKCEELEMEAMCSSGDELMDFLNEVQCVTDPDTVFCLTEEGKAVAKALKENPELTFEEVCAIANECFKGIESIETNLAQTCHNFIKRTKE